ncbi:hypothetical protein, partial [Kingella kingae]|uniref:hypothetical protein n=1 Tax=Kingella kingae TaxID=504 RepID=UPI000570471A
SYRHLLGSLQISFVILSVAVFVDVFKKQQALLLDISNAITFKVIFLIFCLNAYPEAAMMIAQSSIKNKQPDNSFHLPY